MALTKPWRSLTRDPGPFTADPTKIPQWTIFYETLIHDFDLLNFFNPGARATSVFDRYSDRKSVV